MKTSRAKARSQEQRKWIETLQTNNYFRPIKRVRKKPRHEPVPTVAPEIVEPVEPEKWCLTCGHPMFWGKMFPVSPGPGVDLWRCPRSCEPESSKP